MTTGTQFQMKFDHAPFNRARERVREAPEVELAWLASSPLLRLTALPDPAVGPVFKAIDSALGEVVVLKVRRRCVRRNSASRAARRPTKNAGGGNPARGRHRPLIQPALRRARLKERRGALAWNVDCYSTYRAVVRLVVSTLIRCIVAYPRGVACSVLLQVSCRRLGWDLRIRSRAGCVQWPCR
jgi:hypothetical protein